MINQPTHSLALALAAAGLLAISTAALAETTITFDASRDISEYVSNLKSRPFVSLVEEDGSGVLSFRSYGGGELLMIQNQGAPVEPGNAVEIELRSSGQITMGTFLRAHFLGDLAYMAFFSSSPDGTVRLTLAKTVMEQTQRPGDEPIAHSHTRGFESDEWIVVRFSAEDLPDGGVGLRASVTDKASGLVILEVEGEDSNEPIAAGGTLGLRFFANRSPVENRLDIRSITLPQ